MFFEWVRELGEYVSGLIINLTKKFTRDIVEERVFKSLRG